MEAEVDQPTIYCEVCRYDHSPEEVYTLDCGHVFCKLIIKEEIEAKLEQNVSIVKCCDSVCKGLINQRAVRAVCSREMYQKYVELAGKHALAKKVGQGELILCITCSVCPTPECPGRYVVKEGVIKCLCKICGQAYCTKCCRQYHRNSECQLNSIYVKADQREYRPCPVCRQNIRRVRGCKSVTCGSEYCQQQTHFCMLCYKRLSYPDQYHEECPGYDFLEDRKQL